MDFISHLLRGNAVGDTTQIGIIRKAALYFDFAPYSEQSPLISHQCFQHVGLLLVRTLPNSFLVPDFELRADDQAWTMIGDNLRVELA